MNESARAVVNIHSQRMDGGVGDRDETRGREETNEETKRR